MNNLPPRTGQVERLVDAYLAQTPDSPLPRTELVRLAHWEISNQLLEHPELAVQVLTKLADDQTQQVQQP